MKITLLGTGTSQGIPVIGCDCAACRSVDPRDKRLRCSALVQSDSHQVVIDVGPDFRYQMLRSGVSFLDAVLLTHEHNDHIIGLDDLRPFIFMRKSPMKIYGEERVLEQIRTRFQYAFGDRRYPGAPAFELVAVVPGDEIAIGPMIFEAIRIQHGNLPILGYRCGGFAYLTDVKTIPVESEARLNNLEVLVISALRRKPHHAHLTLQESIKTIEKLAPRRGILIHMSHTMGPTRSWINILPSGVEPACDQMVINLTG